MGDFFVQVSPKSEGSGEELTAMTTGEDGNERMSTSSPEPVVPSVVLCTSCNQEIHWETQAIFTNPRLEVLICKVRHHSSCYTCK